MSSVRLTPRQSEVVDLLVQGKSAKQIGKRLGISSNTVRVHLRMIGARIPGTGRLSIRIVRWHITRSK